MASDVSEKLRRLVAERAYHVCEYCLIHEDDTFWGCQVDHIISRKHGGITQDTNLAWACACCNTAKGTDMGTLAGVRRELTRLFHPRSDFWNEHFQLHRARIDAQSQIGHATSKLLKLNDAARVRERECLSQAGRYPTIEALARMKE